MCHDLIQSFEGRVPQEKMQVSKLQKNIEECEAMEVIMRSIEVVQDKREKEQINVS